MNNFATRAIEGLLFRKPELFLVSNLKFPVDLMGELKFSKKYWGQRSLGNCKITCNHLHYQSVISTEDLLEIGLGKRMMRKLILCEL